MRKIRLSNAEDRTYGAPASVLRRVLLGGIALAVLVASAGLLSYLTREEAPVPGKEPPTSKPAPTSPSPRSTPTKGHAAATPPRTSDPIAFAKAATKALWTYDTRNFSRAEHLSGLKRWMTSEKKYADWKSVKEQVPSPVLWSRMHDNRQHSSAAVGEGHFPQAFKSAMATDPGAITKAYAYAVTVTGQQAITWKLAGAGAESRSTTLAVQCRPQQDCALVGVLPQVAP